MIGPLFDGVLLLLDWSTLGYLFLGILVGIWLGAVPGLGGALGIVLALPFTFSMDAPDAIALLLAIYAVTSTSDTISSVLLGIPGTASSQATVLDGYPLAQQGQAARAFGAAFTVSAFGGVFGAIVLAVSLPIIMPIILKFNNPELFMLGLVGLVMVASLTGASIAKGLIAAAFGLLISTVGYADDAAIPRFWIGQSYLLDELPLVPVVLGLFALPEIMDLALRNTSIAKGVPDTGGFAQLRQGIGDAFRNWWLAVRCSAIGVYVGMIPGLGGAVVDWIAYGHAVQSSKDNENFGKGDIRGVIAPEAANNAVRGGALIPTVAFGIPGSAMNALLLSALLIQGLQPGKAMLTTNLDITFSMVWAIAIANIVAAGLLMLWSNGISKLAFISGHLVVPGVMLFILMGAWTTNAAPGDWITLLIFGAIGFSMKRGGWPRPPVILAFVLGGMIENSFLLSWKIHEGLGWLNRPIVLVLLAIIVLTLGLSIRSGFRMRQSRQDPEAKQSSNLSDADADADPLLSVAVWLMMFAVFVAAIWISTDWPVLVAAMPMLAAAPALMLLAVMAANGLWQSRPLGPWLSRHAAISTADPINRRAVAFFAYLGAMLLVAVLVGQKIAIVAFVLAYLVRWGGYRGGRVALYGLACWAVLILFYDRIVHIFWFRPVLGPAISAILPDWFPVWLVI
ncbi:tripartite tricarboxylate transporter permease [Oceaniglobus trochenteri]|uniref:tripartite tricarboxylate transporter permease n=1 Tax=Oceaniglobus trochenteri TaxID=2763260 RepID=UPI001CFFDF3F|nr:tripartite tricarboxylate transporter permease [Oceaniglobus trochenteri]